MFAKVDPGLIVTLPSLQVSQTSALVDERQTISAVCKQSKLADAEVVKRFLQEQLSGNTAHE
jgi:hypothetical protein